MKIRITGRKEELELAEKYYLNLMNESYVKSLTISNFYPNRGSTNQYRLYVDIEYYDSYLLNNPIKGGSKWKKV